MLRLTTRTRFYESYCKAHVSRTLTQDATAKDEPNASLKNDDIEQELYIDTTEDEIESKRNKNRLPGRVYKRHVQKECFRPESKYDFTIERLRGFYGKYGKGSGLNPGIMWPTRERLEEIIEVDKVKHPPIQQSLQLIAAEKEEKRRKQRDYEHEVDNKLKKHDQLLKEYYGRISKREAAVEEAKQKRQLLIEEISDYLGYEVEPRDPKFQEAIQQREQEKKKAQKLKKQQESYNKMMQKLTEIAEKGDDDK